MSDPVIGRRLEQSLLLIASELDEQRRQAAANQTAIMAKLDAILSHMPGVMATIELHTDQIRSLTDARTPAPPPNGKGAH